jgi:2-haloacid dehalogenase
MAKLDLERVRALTFDCYGTLVDWLGGVSDAIRSMASLKGAEVRRLLVDRENEELELEAGPYRPYADILAISMARAARKQHCEPTEAELSSFARGMGEWRPFPETHDALLRLRERYRLAILSNVDTETLERTVSLLDVPFDALVTAQQIRSYKPAAGHFHEALKRLDLGKDQVLHVAQSLRHDIRPAKSLGWSTAWVNRLGESLPMDLKPDLVTNDLTSLCDRLGC